MTKERHNISIDGEVWELAKQKISEPLSCFIQKQLEIACKLDNKKVELEKELHEKEQEVIALRAQLCKIEKEERLLRESKVGYDECMVSISRIHDNLGRVGENQIHHIANAHNIKPNDLISYCKSQGLNVVEFLGLDKEGKPGSNGGRIV